MAPLHVKEVVAPLDTPPCALFDAGLAHPPAKTRLRDAQILRNPGDRLLTAAGQFHGATETQAAWLPASKTPLRDGHRLRTGVRATRVSAFAPRGLEMVADIAGGPAIEYLMPFPVRDDVNRSPGCHGAPGPADRQGAHGPHSHRSERSFSG